MVKTSPVNAEGADLIFNQVAKIPNTSESKKQNIKQKQYCNKFSKDFKNGPYQKKRKKERNLKKKRGPGSEKGQGKKNVGDLTL